MYEYVYVHLLSLHPPFLSHLPCPSYSMFLHRPLPPLSLPSLFSSCPSAHRHCPTMWVQSHTTLQRTDTPTYTLVSSFVVCVCACVHAHARVCVCMCACVCACAHVCVRIACVREWPLALFAAADESRVKLQPIEGRPGSDYINANYIDVCMGLLQQILLLLLLRCASLTCPLPLLLCRATRRQRPSLQLKVCVYIEV